MGILQVIVDSFIVAMGITPPTPKMRRTATIFIATGLLGLGVPLRDCHFSSLLYYSGHSPLVMYSYAVLLCGLNCQALYD